MNSIIAYISAQVYQEVKDNGLAVGDSKVVDKANKKIETERGEYTPPQSKLELITIINNSANKILTHDNN